MKEDLDVHERIDNHEGRIQLLEQHQAEQEKMNGEIRNQLTATENTVLKESGKQQDLVQRLLNHVLDNDVYTRKGIRDRKKYTQQQLWKFLIALGGSGGLIYLLVDNIFFGG